MLKLNKDELYKLYWDREMNPYQIAEHYGCNHKTVRSHLKKHEIPLRTASEYNFLAQRNYQTPSEDSLFSPKSIAAHVAYLCEGWHTEKSNQISFCNQDTQLIDLIVWLLEEVYKVRSVRIVISYPKGSDITAYQSIYPEARLQIDPSRKNPIVRVHSGGKMLVRDLVQNCYSILNSLG